MREHGPRLDLELVQGWGDGDQELRFGAAELSDGTLRALALLTAVHQRPRPSLLIIEEPEATIHAAALGVVLDLLRHAGRTTQLIVTTHSPEILDASWIEDRHLKIVDWRRGATHVTGVSEVTRQAIRQHIMGAGELLRSNALEGADTVTSDRYELFEAGVG